jgi:Uma2 family endonuclease
MNRATTAPLPGTLEDPRYPDQDGRFMGDTDFHNVAMLELRDALVDCFAEQDIYVTSNLIYYFKEGDPTSRRDPDVLVAKGVGKHRRRSYRIWEEKVVPCTLFEMASRDTWRTDLGEKRHLYASLGVKEYFVFDPEGCYIEPVLQGFRTVRGRSVPMKPAADGSLVSKELGLRLVPEGTMLRLIDLKTGRPVLTRAERAEQERRRAQLERRRARQERERARELEAEVERLRALLAKQQRKP